MLSARILHMERTLRTVFLFPAIVCVASGPAVADAPFAPRALQPDYAVTMVQKSYRREVGSRNVTHHGNWTRVDLTKDSHHITEYFSADGIANIRIYGQRYISLVRGGEPSSHRDNQPRNTGERQTHLGGKLHGLGCMANQEGANWRLQPFSFELHHR